MTGEEDHESRGGGPCREVAGENVDDNCHGNVWWHRVEGCKELDILALSPSPDQPKTRDSIRGLKDWQGQSCSRENLARYTALFLSTRNCDEMCKLAQEAVSALQRCGTEAGRPSLGLLGSQQEMCARK